MKPNGQPTSIWRRFLLWLVHTDCPACQAERACTNSATAECDECYEARAW